jgi:hypothetical protein
MDSATPDGPAASDAEAQAIAFIRAEIARATPSTSRRVLEKFLLAALGSIPWVGGFISAAVSLKTDGSGLRTDSLQSQWLEEHGRKIQALMKSLDEVTRRLVSLGPEIEARIESPEYLALVRRAFRAWDRADTDEKRRLLCNLVSNSAGTRLSSDDVVRLFIDWIDSYHEAHFAVIAQIYKTPGITRFDIWDAIRGELPREDSAEADLFKLLIRDLSTGSVIRQDRDTNAHGQFLRRKTPRRKGPVSSTVESAFEETKPYVLTGLGEQFVYYAMNEIVPRLGSAGVESGSTA